MEGDGRAATEPQIAKEAVLLKSEKLPDVTPMVKGYEWNNGIDHNQLLNSYLHSGFQATNLGLAIDEINKMVTYLKIITKSLPRSSANSLLILCYFMSFAF